MANENLKGLKVAILIDDGFEQVEMVEPRKALDQAGAETRIVSPKSKLVRGWNFKDWGDEFPVDLELEQTQAGDFDALEDALTTNTAYANVHTSNFPAGEIRGQIHSGNDD